MRNKIVIVLTAILAMALAGAALAQPGKSFDEADFVAELSGANEVPPVETNTTGEAKFTLAGDTLHFELEIEDATNILGAAGAHIHCAPEGENGPVVAFLAGAVPGGFDGEVEIKASLTDANIVNTSCGSTIAELVQSFRDGNAYVNAHSPAHPGGEVRGQIEEA